MAEKCQYMVSGMTCAACQAHVEKAVSKVPGVKQVTVSLLTNSMSVEGDVPAKDVVSAVEKAGYGAKPMNGSAEETSALAAEEEALKDHETPKLKRRLIFSIIFLVFLMYITMGPQHAGPAGARFPGPQPSGPGPDGNDSVLYRHGY